MAYGYVPGTTAGTVTVPANVNQLGVDVLANSGGAATVVIGGGGTITVPASTPWTRSIHTPGDGTAVVIGGSVASWVVDWVV